MKNKEELKNLTFSMKNLEFSGESDKSEGDKTFEGVAYSGKVIENYSYFGRVIVDLENVTFEEQTPIFLNHEAKQIAGHGQLVSDGRDLKVSGKVFAYSHGEEVIKMSKSGLKWKLSMGWSAESAYELPEGEEKVINGELVTGPLVVFKNPFIGETSFVPIPADRRSSVNIFAKFFKKDKKEINENETKQKEVDMKELEEMKAKFAELTEKFEAVSSELKDIKDLEAAEALEAKFSGLKIEDADKEMLKTAYSSEKPEMVAMADRLLGTFAKEVSEEEAAAKVEAEKAEKAAADKAEKEKLEKEGLSKELFSGNNVKETGTELATSGKSLLEMADALVKEDPKLSRVEAIFKAKELKHKSV